jgi:hypothetical protein
VEERLDELRLVQTIFVKTPPHPNIFFAGEFIQKDAKTWANDYGLKIQGLNSLNELLDLVAGEEYTVGPVDDDGSPGTKTVEVWLNEDANIKTEFKISMYPKFDPADGVVNMGGLPYDSLQEAVDASKGTEENPDRIFVLKDLTIGSKITIPSGKHVLLVPMYGEDDITLTRGDGFDGSLFTVESGASLRLAGSDPTKLVIDGGGGDDITAGLVTVTGGTLTMDTGVKLQNNKNTSNAGGGVYVAGGTFNMTGGTISGNTASNGGGVYVAGSGTFIMSGGTIGGTNADAGNTTSVYGGGVYVAGSGTFTMSGGAISGNTASGSGGGVCVINSGTFTLSGGAISGNTTGANGGGVSVYNGGSFTMTNGAISGNTAGNNGGGVEFYNNGTGYVNKTFAMSGGAINGNTAGKNGGGVYVNGNGPFIMSDSAVVKQNNDVYLPSDKVITVGTLTGSGLVATITPENTSAGTAVLKAGTGTTLLDAIITRFTTSVPGMTIADVDGQGKLQKPADKVAAVVLADGTTIYTATVKEAIGLATDGDADSPIEVRLLADATMGATDTITIPSGKHIRLVSQDSERTITRGASGFGSLFTVESGASLTLGGDYYGLVIDGGKDEDYTAEAALITVDGGTLTMNAGVTLQNNKNTSGKGGGVHISGGAFTMNGGTISGNTATNTDNGDGGGVHVSGGAFTMKGGTISGNTATNNGDGGGVYVYGSGTEFTMTGGTISGNTATNNGGGVYFSGGTFNMTGGAVVKQNNDVYLPSDKVITVGALTGSGLVATITPENTSAGTAVLKAATGTTLSDAIIARFTTSESVGKTIVLEGGEGKLKDAGAVVLADGTTIYKATLQDAIGLATGGIATNPIEVRLLADVTMNAEADTIELSSGKHIRLVSQDSERTITRGANGFGSLFTVGSNASLTLGDNGTSGLVIDGGKDEDYTAEAALITVDGGTLTMNAGVTLQNNNTNTSGKGGGVYVYNSGTFNMNGGTISGNEATNGGGVNIYDSGTFTMNGGTISGNMAAHAGGGVYIDSGTFNKTGGTVYGSDGGANANTAGNNGAALYKYNGNVNTDTGVTGTTNDTF